MIIFKPCYPYTTFNIFLAGKTYDGSVYSRRHKVIQFQYTDWEDHRVPKSPDPILSIIRKMRLEIRSLQISSARILVHCSNGMGQTGTFIALYQLTEMLDVKMDKMFRYSKKELVDNASFYLHNITVDIFETVFELRKKRMNMVCTKKILCITFEKRPLRLNINIFIVFRFSRTTNTNICLTAYQCTQKKNSKEICLWCLTMNSCSWTSHKIWIQKIILSISFKISDDKCNKQILKDFKIIKQNMLVINQFRMIRIYVCIKLSAQIVLFITTFILNTSGNKVVNPIRCMGNRHT